MAGYIGSKAVSVNTTSATITGDASIGGDLSLGDSDKIILGAGSDLQIYHDGSNSFVIDQGTGGLVIRGSTYVALQGTNGENAVIASENGAVDLRYDNATKLATKATGVTVTGEMAATTMDLSSNAVIDGTALVTGVLTTTAATVFNGGFAAVQESTVLIADGQADNEYAFQIKNEEATDDRAYGLLIHAGSTATDRALAINTHDGNVGLFYVQGDGDIEVKTGNLVIGTAGKGIDFSATGNISGTSSELLDDYEEGTYTATITPSGSGSIGLSAGYGSYTKIGNLVTVNASCNTNAISSPVGYFKVSLPFTCNTTNQNGRAAASIYIDGLAGNKTSEFIGLTIENTTECRIYIGDAAVNVADSAQQLDASSYILISVTYRVA